MPPPAKRQYDRNAREAALVEAASEVFAEVGFEAATTRAVADRAGCSEGLIHRYFGGKDGLLTAVLEGRARRPRSAPAPALVDDLAEDLRAVLRTELDELFAERRFIAIALSRALLDAETARFVGKQLQGRRIAALSERLAAHQQAGRIAAGRDLDAAALTLGSVGFTVGFLGRGVFGTPRRRAYETADRIAELVAAGLQV